MSGKVRNIYAGGNTARGFYSYFDSVLQGLDRLFILKGGPGTGKSSLMKKIGDEMLSRGYDIQLIHCASDNDSIDGIIITDLKVGIVDGIAPHVIEPKLPGAVGNYVNLGSAWDTEKLASKRSTISELNDKISVSYENAYSTFAQALKVHDEWEKIYINNMDFEQANVLTNELIQTFFDNKTLYKEPLVRDMYFGAATPKGAVNFIPNLTSDINKRYFIKGRPGSGKSTLLKKLVTAAKERCFDVEIYHCGFDPNSLDMVLLPELSIAIFDSTAPHEYFPERESDEIVDMYARTIKPGTDERYSEELKEITERYSFYMKKATAYLAEAKAYHDQLEVIYGAAMDFSVVEKLTMEIQAEIDRIASNQSSTSMI